MRRWIPHYSVDLPLTFGNCSSPFGRLTIFLQFVGVTFPFEKALNLNVTLSSQISTVPSKLDPAASDFQIESFFGHFSSETLRFRDTGVLRVFCVWQNLAGELEGQYPVSL